MKKMLFSFACLLLLTSGYAQQKFDCPLRNGNLYEHETHLYSHSDPAYGITIISTSQNIVQSAFSGFVLDVLKHDKSSSVIIQKGDTIIAYKDLIEAYVKKGDFVSESIRVGTIAKSDLGYDFFGCLR